MTAPMHDVVGCCLVCRELYFTADDMTRHRRLCGRPELRCTRKAAK